MTPVLLVVALLILAALAVAIGPQMARRRRTVIVDRPVRRVRRVVQAAPVVEHTQVVERSPAVEEIVENRY